jgi:hypothetical protein
MSGQASATVAALVRRLRILYGEPRTADAEAHTLEYHKALGGYAADILEEAADSVIRRHRYRTWPTVGDVTAAAEAISARRREVEARREAAERAAAERAAAAAKAPLTAEQAAEAERLVAEALRRIGPRLAPAARRRQP